MNKYQLTLRCKDWRCDHFRKPYKRTVYVPDGESVEDQPDPPCPKCSKKSKRQDADEMAMPPLPHMGLDLEIGTAPGIIGANTSVKAIDMTADIVMQDYKMTDLKSDVRQGEAMVAPLAPGLQKAADNFFNPGAGGNKRQRIMAQRLGQRAIKGAFRNTALDMGTVTSLAQKRMQGTQDVASYRGEPPKR